ncbi:MAG: chromate transporter [Dehalobacterium sp.]
MILIKLFVSFFKIGLFSFGGGYAMIPLIEKEVVRINMWLTISQMVDIISVSQMTPGPIAINLATYVGYKTAGFLGSLSATFGVVLPSFLIVLVIAKSYSKFKEWDVVQRVFKGIRPMTVALIGSAAFLIARTSLIDMKTVIIGAGSLLLLRYTKISVILLILVAGIAGMILFS